MAEIKKTNEQLHAEFEQALKTLNETLYALLHYGSYNLERVMRDYETKRVSFATMKIGEHRITLEADREGDGTKVEIKFPDNPVNQSLLDCWDRCVIDKDIAYHQRELEELRRIKDELSKK